jgi:hypothetical protein
MLEYSPHMYAVFSLVVEGLASRDVLSLCMSTRELMEEWSVWRKSSVRWVLTEDITSLSAFCYGLRMGALNLSYNRAVNSWKIDLCFFAARDGHLRIVHWMIHNPTVYRSSKPSLWQGAAHGGQMHVLRWLHENDVAGCCSSTLVCAGIGGFPLVMQFLQDVRPELGDRRGRLLSSVGQAHTSNRRGTRTQQNPTRKARMGFIGRGPSFCTYKIAANGELACLQWMFRNREGPEVRDQDALGEALMNGHLDVADWLMTQGINECRLEVVDWLEQNQAPCVIEWVRTNSDSIVFTRLKLIRSCGVYGGKIPIRGCVACIGFQ